MTKQKIYLFSSIVSVFILLLGVSYAFFMVRIEGNGKTINVTSAELKLTFNESSNEIQLSNLEPGVSIPSKTFTIVSSGLDSAYKYNIIMKDLVNTFVTEGYLQYRITGTGSGAYSTSGWVNVPKKATATDTIIAEDVSIAPNITHTYTVEFHYLDDDSYDQSADMNKTFSGSLAITQGTTQTN